MPACHGQDYEQIWAVARHVAEDSMPGAQDWSDLSPWHGVLVMRGGHAGRVSHQISPGMGMRIMTNQRHPP